MDIGKDILISGSLELSVSDASIKVLSDLEDKINEILDGKLQITLDRNAGRTIEELARSLELLSKGNLTNLSRDINDIFSGISSNENAISLIERLNASLKEAYKNIGQTGKTAKSNSREFSHVANEYIKAINQFKTLNTQKINGKEVTAQQEEANKRMQIAEKNYLQQISNLSQKEVSAVKAALADLKNATTDAETIAADKKQTEEIKNNYKIQSKLSQEQRESLRKTEKAYNDLAKSAEKYYNLLLKNSSNNLTVQERQTLNDLNKKFTEETNNLGVYANGNEQQKEYLNTAIKNAREKAIANIINNTERYFDKNIFNNQRRYNENSAYQDNIEIVEKNITELKNILNDPDAFSKAFIEGSKEAEHLGKIVNAINLAIHGTGNEDTNSLAYKLKHNYNYDLASPVDVSNFQRRVSEFYARNPLAYQQYSNDDEKNQVKYRNEIFNLDINKTTLKQLDDYKVKLETLQKEAFNAGNFGNTLINGIDSFINNNFLNLTSLFAGFNLGQKIGEAVQQAKALNTQMVELSKVSDTALSTINNRFDDFYSISKELGSSITDTIAATADQARNGYSIPDSEELARVAVLYKNIGDGINIDEANSSLISTLRGFKLEASDAMEIIDKFNEVSNNFPISSAGIGEALKRSAASFNAASTDLSQSIALVTATNSVIQNPEVVGTLQKSVSARIRGAKSELEEMGEETDGVVKSTSKLRAEIKAITGFDIMQDENTYKSIYDIIIGIGKKWNDISDINRAALLEDLAGKRSANALVAVLQNVEMLEKAYQTAENSAGSAMEEQQRYQEGMQYHIDEITIAQENLSHTLVDSNTIKFFADLATAVLDLFNNFSKLVGIAPEVAIILGSIALRFKTFNDVNGNPIGKGFSGYIAKIGEKLSTINAADRVDHFQESKASLQAVGKEAVGQVTGFINSFAGKAAIASAIIGLYSQASKYQDEMDAAVQKLGIEFKSSVESIDYYKERINALKDTVTNSTSSFEEVTQARKELMSVQSELIEKFGQENNAINLITDSINNQTSALDKLKESIFESNQNKYVSEQNGFLKSVQRNLSYMVQPQKQFDENGNPIVIETAEDELIRTMENYTDSSIQFASIFNRYKNSFKLNESIVANEINKVLADNNVEISSSGKLIGNIYDVENALKDLKTVVKSNEGYFTDKETYTKLNNELSKLSGNLNNVKNNYEELYNGYVLYNEVLPDKQITAQYDAINDAYEKYKEAVNSGNEKLQKETAKSFTEVLNKAMDSVEDNPRVYNYFKNLFSDMQNEVGVVELTLDLQVKNTKEITDEVKQNLISQLKNIDISDFTSESLDNFLNLNHDSIKENKILQENLNELANEYHITVSQLVDVFTELGLVQTDVQKQFIKMFGSDIQNGYEKQVRRYNTATGEEYYETQKQELSDREKKNISNTKDLLTAYHNAMIQDFEKQTGLSYTKIVRNSKSAIKEIKDEADSILTAYTPNKLNIAKIISNTKDTNSISEMIDSASESVSNYEENISKLASAIKNQNSSSAVSLSTFNNLKEVFNKVGVSTEKLSDYYKLTEKGIELNISKVRKLMGLNQQKSINKVNLAYKELAKQYNQQYYELTEYQNALLNTTKGEEQKRNALQQLINEKKKDIQTTKEQKATLDVLYGQLQNMTQIYSEYIDALSSTNAGSAYDQVVSSFETIQNAVKNGDFGTDEVQKQIQLMTGEDVSYFNRDLIAQKSLDALKIFRRYFTETNEGIENAYKDIIAQADKSESVLKGENGEQEITNFKLLAADMGTSVDTLILLLNKMKDKGFNIKFNVEDAQLESDYEKLSELQAKQLQIGIGVDKDLDRQVEELKEKISKEEYNAYIKFHPEYDAVTTAVNDIKKDISKLLGEHGLTRQDIDFSQFINVDLSSTEIKDKNGNTIDQGLASKLKESYDEAQKIINDEGLSLQIKIGADFELESADGSSEEGNVDGESLANKITSDVQEEFNKAKVDLKITVDKDGNIQTFTKELNEQKKSQQNPVNIKVDLTTNFDAELNKLKEITKLSQPQNYAGDTSSITKGINTSSTGTRKSEAKGQLNSGPYPTLVGELGPEIHVNSSNGTQELLGQNGAEFVKHNRIKSNDIVYNAEQTREILGNAYANGLNQNKIGNVDINARPIVHNADGTYSTTSTAYEYVWVGDEEHGHYLLGHFATIRNDGSRLSDPELQDYTHYVLGSQDPFATDAAMDNLLYAVVERLANGEQIVDSNLQQAKDEAVAWDENMHKLQDSMYRSQAYTNGLNNADLLGEIGPEIVVHGNEQNLVPNPILGQNLVKPNDIVFDAEQTKNLLTKGSAFINGQNGISGKSFAGNEKQTQNGFIKGVNSVSESKNLTATGKGAVTDSAIVKSVIEQFSGNTKATESSAKATNKNTAATQANTDALDDTKKEYDWIERRMSFLDHHITMLDKTADNSRISNEKRQAAYEHIQTIQNAKLTSLNKALEVYQTELGKLLTNVGTTFAGYLSSDQINLLMSQITGGNVDLDTWKSVIKPTGTSDTEKKVYETQTKLLDDIADMIGKVQSTEGDLADTGEEMEQTIEDIYNLRLAEQEAILSEIEATGSKIQSKMTLKTTTGKGIVSTSDYEALIDNSEDKVSALQDKLHILTQELSEQDTDSEKYYEIQKQIQSVKQEIQQCAEEQAEWNEAIKELPITYIKNYITNLNSIAENLTNYISILETAGNTISAKIIGEQVKLTEKIATQYTKQLELLQKKMDTYTPGSDKQNESFASIQEIENSISSIVQQMKEYEKQVLNLPIEKLNKMSTYLSNISNALNDIQDDNLTRINAAIEIINRNAEMLIKPLQKQLDILEKQNEARKLQLAIEQAEYDLAKAQEELTIQTVNSKGELVYTADEEAIRNAQQAYQEAEYNKKVADLQNQINRIQEEADEHTEKYEQIEKDVTYNQLVDDAAKLVNTTAAKLEKTIISNNDEAYYQAVKTDYETTADQIKATEESTKNLTVVTSLLEQLNERRLAGEITESEYNSLVKSVTSKAEAGTLTNVDVLNTLLRTEGYKNVDSVNATIKTTIASASYELTNASSETNTTLKQIKALYDKYFTSYESLLKKIEELLEQANKAYENTQKAVSSSYSRSSSSSSGGGSSSSGGGGSRVIASGVSDSDRYRLDVGVSSGLLKGPISDSKHNQELIQRLGIEPVDGDTVLSMLKPNELVANTEQQAQIISNLKGGIATALSSGVGVSSRTPQVNITMGDINLPNVKDADGFAKAMQDTFELSMSQYFSKVF